MNRDIYYIVYLKDESRYKLEPTTIGKRFCGRYNHEAWGIVWFELNGSGAYVAIPEAWIECIAPSKELWSE